MEPRRAAAGTIPSYALYGEKQAARGAFPDVLHVETIADRAAAHDWTVGDHRHAALAQFLWLTGGGAEARQDGRAERLGPGCGAYTPPLVVHGFDFLPETTGWVLSVEAARLTDGPEGAAILRPGPAQAARIGALMALTAEEHAGAAPGRAGALARLADLIAIEFARAAEAARPASAAGDPARALVGRYLALLDAEYRAHPSVAESAARLGVTATHLSRTCREVAGAPASALLHGRLMLEARRMLVYTPTPVAGIGYALGFADPAWFTRFFTRHEGVSPRRFRREAEDGAARRNPGGPALENEPQSAI